MCPPHSFGDPSHLTAENTDVPVIASGGVTTIEDVKKLAELPIAGIIIGRALYEDALDLAEAIEVLS